MVHLIPIKGVCEPQKLQDGQLQKEIQLPGNVDHVSAVAWKGNSLAIGSSMHRVCIYNNAADLLNNETET
jgi:hypothetical protein